MLSITVIKGWHDLAKYYLYISCISSSFSYLVPLDQNVDQLQ